MDHIADLLASYEAAINLNSDLTKQGIALDIEIDDLRCGIDDMEKHLSLARKNICNLADKNRVLIKLIAESANKLDVRNNLSQDIIYQKSKARDELKNIHDHMLNQVSIVEERLSEVTKINELLNIIGDKIVNQK